MDQNYCSHYDNVLNICTAIWIWMAQSITPGEVHQAQECHTHACKQWACMNCHLTPNFHLLMHTSTCLLCLGPTYVFWTYGHEHNNGWLMCMNTNNHTGGELEATMLQSWIKHMLLQDLVSYVLSAFNMNTTNFVFLLFYSWETLSLSLTHVPRIEKLHSHIKGEKKLTGHHGTLMEMIVSRGSQLGESKFDACLCHLPIASQATA